jgi:hypothetical protein
MKIVWSDESLGGLADILPLYRTLASIVRRLVDIIIIIVTQGWVVNGVRRHAEPLGDNDPPQLFCRQDM